MEAKDTVVVDVDLANWMTNLSPRIRDLPLIFIAIPGSHNTMMYQVMKNSAAAPDAPSGLQFFNRLFPTCVQSWILTQTYGIRQQLEHGVRYLDIRTSFRKGQFMFCHGLYACDSLQPLEEVNRFLDAHPKELVILDFQHVYNCDRTLHQKYCDTIISIFGHKILPRNETNLRQCSLKTLADAGHQVIVVYRMYCDDAMIFWCSYHFPTPWPNTMSGSRLKQTLGGNIQLRDRENGHVTQCVLTPTLQYILLHPFGSIRNSCATAVLRKLEGWFRTCETGPNTHPSFNVFIADYVDLEEDQFTKTVIKLNLLMEEQDMKKTITDTCDQDQGHVLEMVPEEEDDKVACI